MAQTFILTLLVFSVFFSVQIAKKLGKSPGQVALRWGIQYGVDVLPKSTNPKRIKENLDVFSWSIPEDDFKALSSIQPQVTHCSTAVLHSTAEYSAVHSMVKQGLLTW